MIETFLYIANNFERLSAYSVGYDINNQPVKGYKENYQRINELSIQSHFEVPYVFTQNKAIFLAKDVSTASDFVKILNPENLDAEHIVIPVVGNDLLVRRLIRNALLMRTNKYKPYRKKYGIEYLIDTNNDGDIVIRRFLNATFSNFPGSNILQLIFDLKSRPSVSWDKLPNKWKLFCSPSPRVRYDIIMEKLTEIFDETMTIAIPLPGNGIINFEQIQVQLTSSH